MTTAIVLGLVFALGARFGWKLCDHTRFMRLKRYVDERRGR